MKWPILEPVQSTEPAAASRGDISGLPIGINRERGEGGFWGRIAFQDTYYPERYAFVRQHRMVDSVDSEVKFWDANQGPPYPPTPGGEQSVWNDGTPTSPFTQPDTGRVWNWAVEANGSQNVPVGAIVWIRGGETYTEEEFGNVRTDYTFAYHPTVFASYGLATAAGGVANPVLQVSFSGVDSWPVVQGPTPPVIRIHEPGVYLVLLTCSVHDVGGVSSVMQTITANLTLNGAPYTPSEARFLGDGNSDLVSMATQLIITDADFLEGLPPAVSLRLRVTTNGGYTPTGFAINDGELIIKQP